MFRPFDPYEDNYEYSPNIRNFGNPLVNGLMRGVFGGNLMPVPGSGQDIYDSFLQRERSMNFMNLQRESFMNNRFFQQLGVSQNPLLGVLGATAASPDSMIGRLMSPVLGGNPMAASMQLYAGMSGANLMGNFGRTQSMGVGEVSGIMQTLTDSMYNTQKFEGSKGIGEQINRQSRDFLKARLREGGAVGKKYVEDIMGRSVSGVDDIDSLDIASNTSAAKAARARIDSREIKKATSVVSVSKELESLEAEEDPDKQKEINKKITKLLEDKLKLHGSQLDKLKKYGESDQLYDTSKVRKELDRFNKRDPLAEFAAEANAFRDKGKRFTNYNFENSRGFQIEDFTSAYVKGADMRMLGDSRGRTPAGAMKDLFTNGTGALSAARALFGNKSGGELMENISDFMGNTAVDLTRAEGAGGANEVEDLLRKVKSTARVAGVGIKAMLGIIKSTHELAANNPQLQYVSGSTLTEVARQAVSSAADMGRSMSAEDYRRAGGSQGIAAEEIKSKANFAQSSLGGFAAVMLNLADEAGGDTKKAVEELFAGGKMTARGLDQGGMRELVAAFGGKYTAANLLDMGQSQDLIQNSLKNDRVSKQIMGKEGEKALLDSFYQGMEFRGLDRKKFTEGFKNYKGSIDQYINTNIRPYTTDASGTAALKAAESALRKDLVRGTRTDKQNAEYDKLVADQAKSARELDKKYGALYAPAVTQVISALAGGNISSFEEISQAMTGIFATRDTDDATAKAALDRVKENATNVTVLSGRYNDTKSLLGAGIVGELNKFTRGRKEAAAARGEGDTTKDLGDISASDYEAAIDAVKTLDALGVTDAKGANARITQLKEQKALAESQGEQFDKDNAYFLKGLEGAKHLGALNESGKAFKNYMQGNASGLNAASIQAAVDAEVKADITRKEKSEDTDLAARLGNQAKAEIEGGSSDLQQALNAYTQNGKIDAGALRKDIMESSDSEAFYKRIAAQTGMSVEDAQKKYGKDSKLANILVGEVRGTTEAIDLYKEDRASKGHMSPEDRSRTDLLDAFKSLTSTFKDGGGIANALKAILTQLQKYH